MAINNINSSLNGLSNKTSSAKTSKQGATSESSSSSVSKGTVAQDTVKLTDQAMSLSRLQQKISDAPDTDDNKVATIKAAIERGDYKINADRVARENAQASALISALTKLYQSNASTLTPDPLYSRFYDSHPNASERIAALKAQN